jgi:hypothetical protein
MSDLVIEKTAFLPSVSPSGRKKRRNSGGVKKHSAF